MTIPVQYADTYIDDAFDVALAFALGKVRAMHPVDAFRIREDAHQAVRNKRSSLYLTTIRGKKYWRAHRFLGKVNQCRSLRCTDDHDPGGPNDLAFSTLKEWVQEVQR